jgi:RNA polymerase sigma-70 factor (ECF subfamily)
LHQDADQELMARIQADDVRAFELLYARYAHPLLNFFYQMCFDRTASEDYLQETFLRVWRARRTYRPIGKVSTWLYQIAKNFWFNEREKLLRRPFHAGSGGDDARAQWQNVADPRGELSPLGAAGAREAERLVSEAVSGLSEKLRVVFVLARYRGLPYADVAEILDIPVGTVKSRMSLAEKTLRDRLRPHVEGA